MITLSRNPILNYLKKYVFSEGEQFPLKVQIWPVLTFGDLPLDLTLKMTEVVSSRFLTLLRMQLNACFYVAEPSKTGVFNPPPRHGAFGAEHRPGVG